jgi:hypothetical protein
MNSRGPSGASIANGRLFSGARGNDDGTAGVKGDIAIVARCMEAGTLIMSAGHALAFTGGAFDAAHWVQVAFGCFVPAIWPITGT